MAKRFIFCILVFLSACGQDITAPKRYTNEGISSSTHQETGILKITIINVGEGDSALIESPNGSTILIDGGPINAGTEKILPLLKNKDIGGLDYIFISHFDEDHIGGIPEVIKGGDGILGTQDDIMPKYGIWDRGEPSSPNKPAIKEYLDVSANHRHTITAGDTWRPDNNLELIALITDGHLSNGNIINIEADDENARSVGLKLIFGRTKYLTCGDMPGGGGTPPYETVDAETTLAPLAGDTDILHVNHHGSHTSTNQSFLDIVRPELAVISVGNGNDHWHPHKSVIDRLLNAGIAVYLTEKGYAENAALHIINGDIIISSDGEDYWVQ